jgi:molybdate transport system ATP-binding protein
VSGLRVSLRKRTHGFTLDAHWEMRPEIAVLFGYSGSGKSMTMRMIAGLLSPDEGRIECGGKTLYDSTSGLSVRAQERGFGYVGQEVSLFPHLSVAENIAYGLRGTRTERANRVAELLAWFHLEGLAKRRPGEVSGGQRQRVALARALARRPRALLLDEPFSALDMPLRNELWGLLREVHDEHDIPVLMVTHDPYEARSMADRIIVYSEGRAIRSGTPGEVLACPDAPEVETLLVGWRAATVDVA